MTSESMEYTSRSLADTERLGKLIGKALEPGDVVGLVGDMGAGKTTLVRDIARGAGIPDNIPVNSPTFTILNLYDTTHLRIAHLDLYRLIDPTDLEAIGIDDLMSIDAAFVVEWFDLFPSALGNDSLIINIIGLDEHSRRFEFRATGAAGRELLNELSKTLLPGAP